MKIELDRGLKRALELKTFLPEVPYKRYERRGPVQRVDPPDDFPEFDLRVY